MGGYMPKNIIDSFKKQKETLDKFGKETDIIQTKPIIKSKATGLPEAKPVQSIDSLKKQSEDKINEMRKKGYIK